MPNVPSVPSNTRAAIDAFREKLRTPAVVAPGARGRLLFGADATASREPMWELACRLQGEMFKEVAKIGGLDVQLVHYFGPNGFNFSPWVSDATALAKLMGEIECVSGYTQIAKVLTHARTESAAQKLSACVFTGDCVEEEPAALYALADRLGVPAFMFLEGDDPHAAEVFQEIARRTNGAYCRFDAGAADQLRDLLRAVAAYAVGGVAALAGKPGAVLLLEQLKK